MYADQSRAAVDRERSVFETVSEGFDELQLGSRSIKSRAYLSWFNFKGGDQQKPVGALSGGELNRLSLAQVVKGGGNVLLGGMLKPNTDQKSDEHHRILTTFNRCIACAVCLEEALLSFAGCAVIVSHDIAFLNRVATHILAFEGDLVPGQVTFFEGNFSAYLEDKKRRSSVTSPTAVPVRVNTKKWVHLWCPRAAFVVDVIVDKGRGSRGREIGTER
ncbi:P-loop containing nucleoside triphosphate hydrolase [Gracilaria domingensis]|nr:P-loop containing nucleoside triphosphate hydrolase [Gracilaria domingensis]